MTQHAFKFEIVRRANTDLEHELGLKVLYTDKVFQGCAESV